MGFMGPPDAIEHPSWLWTPGRPECLALQASASVVEDQHWGNGETSRFLAFHQAMKQITISWFLDPHHLFSIFADGWFLFWKSVKFTDIQQTLVKMHFMANLGCLPVWFYHSFFFLPLLGWDLTPEHRALSPWFYSCWYSLMYFALLQIFCYCKNLTFRPSVWAEHGFTGHPAGQVDLFAVCGTWALPKQFLKKMGDPWHF